MITSDNSVATSSLITYARVVSCETVRLALTIAALNDLEVKVSDGLNACITVPITEKVWKILGPEFGPDASKSALIVRALYGLKVQPKSTATCH